MSSVPKKAIIYCRVSSAAQVKRGDGLDSQATRCSEYARLRDYEVMETFSDDLSGSLIARPGMKMMLAYLRNHRADRLIVLIDDISRLARGVRTHIELRTAISRAGGTLESPTLEFADDADSELQEYILATVAQHQRRKNAEQTKNRMRARLMNGYWPFPCPVGYRYEKAAGQGKILARNEPVASIVQKALEDYASGVLRTQAEIRRYLQSEPNFPKKAGGLVTSQKVTDLLKRPVYAGYVEARLWGISLRPGNHQSIISLETFQRNQHLIASRARTRPRQDLDVDFPLRGAVFCGDCGGPFTGCWATGAYRRYAYYYCFKRGCRSYGKSVRRDVIESELELLLEALPPSRRLARPATEMFKDLWKHRLSLADERKRSLQGELARVEQQSRVLLERAVSAELPSVATAYESRIRTLEDQCRAPQSKLADCDRPPAEFDRSLATALAALERPLNLWRSRRLEDTRATLRFIFGEGLVYSRGQGFRAPRLSPSFKTSATGSTLDSSAHRPAEIQTS